MDALLSEEHPHLLLKSVAWKGHPSGNSTLNSIVNSQLTLRVHPGNTSVGEAITPISKQNIPA